jgi:hypothetical protein
VILLPGSVLPARLAYGALLAVLGDDVDAVAKELELYATPEPPSKYSLDTEVDGVLRDADARGWGSIPPRGLLRRRRSRAGIRGSSSAAVAEPGTA